MTEDLDDRRGPGDAKRSGRAPVFVVLDIAPGVTRGRLQLSWSRVRNHEYRTVALVDDVHGDAAERDTRQSGASVGAHHYQRRRQVVRVIQERDGHARSLDHVPLGGTAHVR